MTTPRALPTWLIAALLFAVACALRLPGYDHGLPHRSEPDTYVVEQAAGLERRGLLSRYDAAWKYPLFVATLVAAVPARELVPPDAPPSPAVETPHTLEQHLAVAGSAHAHARFVVALFSALIAPLTYLLARAFLPRRWSVLAALLAATSLLHLCFSLQARPHAPASVTTLLALVACVRFARDPRSANGMWLGLGCGLAVATLHTGAMVLAPLTVALALGARGRGRRVIGPGALALALVLGAAAWAYVPGERIRDTRAREAAQTAVVRQVDESPGAAEAPALRFSGHVVPLSLFNGAGFRAIAEALGAYDPFVLAASAVGAVFIAMSTRRRMRSAAETRSTWTNSSSGAAALVLAGYYVPALFVYGVFARTEARLVLSFVPLVALVATCGLAGVTRQLGARWRPALVAASLTVTLVPALRLMWLRTRTDTPERAAAYLTSERMAPNADVLCLNVLSLPLVQAPGYAHPDGLWSRSRWERHQAALQVAEQNADESTAQRLGVRLRYPSSGDLIALWTSPDPADTARTMLATYSPVVVVFGTSMPATIVAEGTRRTVAALREVIQGPDYELVETFAASAPGAFDVDVGFQTTFAIVMRARLFGPRIEIWRRTGAGESR